MNDILDEYKKKPLSNKNILKLLDGKTKIVLYPQLKKYKTLDQLLYPYDSCVLLYMTKENFGHWCCVIKIDDKTVEFFDPYGTFPDDQLKMIPEYFRKVSGQNYPHLTWLLYHSPYKLTYNHHKFQKNGADVQTCGRHCATRILLKEMPLKQYIELFKGANPDDIVTFLTMAINSS